ncbi:MAG: ABC-2 type transport system permease protein [Planctomycetota bacterium]|jgi:ABC-2 type transport system permease protein
MSNTLIVFKRELRSYFTTPVAYVFLVVFLILTGVFTWYMGGMYDRNQADLQAFFGYHPWLYLALIPAISMRMWSEERRGGTIELLLTLPITMWQAVAGKFLAAWAFCGIALLLTTTNWISVAYLGDPDHGVIMAGYLGSFLMAGGFLAIGSFISALTKNQVIAFVITVMVSMGMILAGFPMVLDIFSSWAPDFFVDTIRSFSFLTHFDSITRGVIEARDLLFFVTLILFFLFANAVAVDLKKAK